MKPRRASGVHTSTLASNLAYLRDLKRKYAPLFAEPIVRLPDGSTKLGSARHFLREGIHVLHLKGDSFQLAYQHGKLLESQVKHGVLSALSKSIPHMLENSVSRNPILNRIVIGLVDFMGRNLRKHIPQQYLAESFALSEGSGLALHHVSNALLAMEGIYILAKYAVKSKQFALSPMAFAGCSSFAAWDRYTEDGGVLIGRNLDYPLNGFFDNHPTVMYLEPTDQGQRYMTLGTAGLFTPSLTAMNESGIYIAGHIVPTEETSFHGTPMYFVAADVIKNARTFDEAVARFRAHRTTCGWSYVLVSVKEKRAASVEMTTKRVVVRESKDGTHFQSNHFSLMEDANLYVNKSILEDSVGRYNQMKNRLTAAHGPIDIATAASILGDPWDPNENRERGLGATVAVHITVGSAVFQPTKGRFFVAVGKAPVSQNDFIEFPDLTHFDPDRFATQRYERASGNPFGKDRPAIAAAVQAYIKAKMAYEYESDLSTALKLLQEVVILDPDNAAYWFVLAILALKQDKIKEADEALTRILSLDHTAQLHNLAHYYRGRIRASHGNSRGATQDFENVMASPEADGKLKHAARKARNICRIFGRYNFRTDRLPLMMQFADMLNY